jgi:hypothetical protein
MADLDARDARQLWEDRFARCEDERDMGRTSEDKVGRKDGGSLACRQAARIEWAAQAFG